MMRAPTQGRIVQAVGHEAGANGTDVASALITRVWSANDDGSYTVNATIFPDAGQGQESVRRVTSVRLWEDEAAARGYLGQWPDIPATALFWPVLS